MSTIQIDETDGGSYFYVFTKPSAEGKTLAVFFGEDEGVQQVFIMPDHVLYDDPQIEAMSWDELERAGFVRI